MSLTSRGQRDASPRLAPPCSPGADVTQATGTASDGPQSGETQSDSTQSDGPQPDGPQPDGPQPDGSQPDGSQPDGSQPDGSQPDGPQPDGPQWGGTRSDETLAEHETQAEIAGHRRARLGPLALARRPAAVAVAIGLLIAGTGTAGLLMSGHSRYVPPHVARVKPVLPPVGPQQQTPAPQVAEQVAPPVSLTIPVIGVRTSLIDLGVTRSGALQVPKSTAVAGWYTRSPRPGAVGSSVIAGHVDSYLGPGVFFRLHLLHRGDRIYVRQAGGRLAVFRVSSVSLYTHVSFPTISVYGPTPTPTLRLITCGGTFDPQTRGYLSNVVVYAVLTS